MNLFDDCGDESDRLFARYGFAGCLAGDDDDPGMLEPAGSSPGPSVSITRDDTSYTVDKSGVVRLGPVEAEATMGPSPSASSSSSGWKIPQQEDEPLPVFTVAAGRPASGGAGVGLLLAAGVGAALLLSGQKK